MKKILLSVAIIATSFTTIAQVGVGTTDPKAGLDITSDKGMLLPRIADHTTLTPVDGTLDANEAGLQIYNTTTKSIMLWNGTAWSTSTNPTSSLWVDLPDTRPAITYKKGLQDFQTATDTLQIYKTSGAAVLGLYSTDKVNAIGIEGNSYNAIQIKGNSANSLFRIIGGRGTVDAKTPLQSGNTIGKYSFSGYYNTTGGASGVTASIIGKASEIYSAGNYGTKLEFETTANTTTVPVTRMTISDSGNVGIGFNTPGQKLVVAADVSPQIRVLNTGAFHQANSGAIVFSEAFGLDSFKLRNDGTGGADRFVIETSDVGDNFVMMRANGNIGIGSAAIPSAKLDVAGAIKIGDTAATAVAGMIKFDGTNFFGYNGSAWVQLNN